jgi:AcrR family transcriptional regulator
MTVKERRARESEEMRQLILDAAGGIIAEEGIESLSVRKLASRIDYSPAIIYHYFHDKGDIINVLMQRGYAGIVEAISSAQSSDPMQRLEEMTDKYISAALAMPDVYKTVLLNGSPDVLEHTSALFQGARESRQAINMLCRCLEDICAPVTHYDVLIELTAQVIFTSTFGLIIRLIIEKELPTAQKEALVARHLKMIADTARSLANK